MIKQLPNIEATSEFYPGMPTVRVEPASNGTYQYFWLVRDKKHHSWKAVAFFNVAGDSCPRNGYLHFAKFGYIDGAVHHSLARMADKREWEQFQATANKKKGIK